MSCPGSGAIGWEIGCKPWGKYIQVKDVAMCSWCGRFNHVDETFVLPDHEPPGGRSSERLSLLKAHEPHSAPLGPPCYCRCGRLMEKVSAEKYACIFKLMGDERDAHDEVVLF